MLNQIHGEYEQYRKDCYIWHTNQHCHMQRLFTTLLCTILSCLLYAQQDQPLKPRFTKQAIATTGCSAYLPEGVEWKDPTTSPDGSDIYQCSRTYDGGYEFGLILVKFNEPFTTSSDIELEELLIAYADYLKEMFSVKEAVGYGKGHRLDADTTVLGVIDYWKAEDNSVMSVQGWINPQYLAFYYISGPDDKADVYRAIFFKGLRLPGE